MNHSPQNLHLAVSTNPGLLDHDPYPILIKPPPERHALN